jgi:hypothetical protein
MTGVRVPHAPVLPFRHLGEGAQADDGLVPAQLAGPERRRGEPATRTRGVGKPAAATARCTIVSLRAAPGSGIRRATSSAGQPSGGRASENDISSAQKPPGSGSGRRP